MLMRNRVSWSSEYRRCMTNRFLLWDGKRESSRRRVLKNGTNALAIRSRTNTVYTVYCVHITQLAHWRRTRLKQRAKHSPTAKSQRRSRLRLLLSRLQFTPIKLLRSLSQISCTLEPWNFRIFLFQVLVLPVSWSSEGEFAWKSKSFPKNAKTSSSMKSMKIESFRFRFGMQGSKADWWTKRMNGLSEEKGANRKCMKNRYNAKLISDRSSQ